MLKIFTLHRTHNIAPNTDLTVTWLLSDPLRYFNITSVYFNFSCHPYKIPDEIQYQLYFGGTALIFDAYNEASFNIPLVSDSNGRRIYFNKAGQYFFKNWTASESVPVNVNVVNTDLLITHQVHYDVVVETEVTNWKI